MRQTVTGESNPITLTNERGRLLQIVIDHMVQKAEKLCAENTSQANIKAKSGGTMLPHAQHSERGVAEV